MVSMKKAPSPFSRSCERKVPVMKIMGRRRGSEKKRKGFASSVAAPENSIFRLRPRKGG